MSDTHPGPEPTEDAAAAEVERLQAERDELAREVEELQTPRKRRFRRAVVGLLVALSCILVVMSTTVVWAHRTVLNTDTFVGTVGPVFQYPGGGHGGRHPGHGSAVHRARLQAELREALPPKVSFAAGPITDATEGYVSGQLAKVLGSDRFQTVWIKTLTSTHETLVAVLRGKKTSTISTANGYIVLNTVPVINKALGSVSGLASNLTGKKVTLPTITSAEPPKQAVAKLSKALGVQAAHQLRPDHAGAIDAISPSPSGASRPSTG